MQPDAPTEDQQREAMELLGAILILQVRALAGRTLDMLDGINALPDRQDRPKERMREAVEAPERPVEAPRAVEALSGARAIIAASLAL